ISNFELHPNLLPQEPQLLSTEVIANLLEQTVSGPSLPVLVGRPYLLLCGEHIPDQGPQPGCVADRLAATQPCRWARCGGMFVCPRPSRRLTPSPRGHQGPGGRGFHTGVQIRARKWKW